MVTALSLFAVFRFLKRAGCAAAALLLAAPSFGDVIYTGSSVVFSGSNMAGLSARATFTVDPMNSNVLRLLLENTTSRTTMAPSELLTSVYFNVLSGTTTGTPAPLTYKSASGNVFLAVSGSADRAALYTPPTPPSTKGSVSFSPLPIPPSNLMAVNRGDDTWQFRNVFSLVTTVPPLKFGVGTVGNSSLNPNNFQGNIVGGFDFGIYTGDVETRNLDNTLLVKDSALFEFGGFGSFGLAQVSPHVVFGFGSSPDCIISVPEPSAFVIAALGIVACGVGILRRRSGSVRARAGSQRWPVATAWPSSSR
jgi:hypothetical protein